MDVCFKVLLMSSSISNASWSADDARSADSHTFTLRAEHLHMTLITAKNTK